MTALALAFLAPFLVQDKPEESQEMKWVFAEGDRFELKWGYNEQRKREGQDKAAESHDKRDLDAELTWKADGILTLTIKKVTWSFGSQDYEIGLAFAEGKKLAPELKMKIAPNASSYNNSKAEADRMVEAMKKLTAGEYLVDTVTEKGRTLFLWEGGNVRQNPICILNKLFTHPLLPSGPVRKDQIFKDPLEAHILQPGLTDIKEVQAKVTAVGDKGLIARGGLTIPFGKTFTANSQVQNMTGSYSYSNEWNYSPRQYLQRSAEEEKFTKKIDAKGKDADFYKENLTHTAGQVLTIKKLEPKPGDKKPDEKKPDEKKPEGKADEKK